MESGARKQLHDGHGEKVDQEERSPVADEGERNAGDGHQVERHAHIDDDVYKPAGGKTDISPLKAVTLALFALTSKKRPDRSPSRVTVMR